MAISTDEIWKLCVASGLWSPERCGELKTEFLGLKGAARQAGAASLTEWLIACGALSRYQASVLLSGRPGPFVFGDFVIHERIDEGRLARAFRATFKNAQQALLVFAAGSRDSPRQARITIDRFEAARAIKSPHVSRVYQYQAVAAPPFFVLEDLQGKSLREWLAGQKPTVDEACRIGFQAALGLLAIQTSGGVHGNLTPHNLWIEPSSSVKLLQFPLTGPVPAHERFRPVTVDYLAPELANAGQPPDALTDIYSLGCTLYELISGRVPFAGGSVQQTLARHAAEIPERLDRLVPGVTEEVADLVEEMLAKEPLLRAQTASHVAHLLAPYSSGVHERHTRKPPPDGPERLAPGYGAWSEPGWQPPPQQPQPPRAVPATKPAVPAAKAPTKPAPRAAEKPAHGSPPTARPASNPVARPTRPPASPRGTDRRPAEPTGAPKTVESDAPRIVVDTRTHEPGATSVGAATAKRRRPNTIAIAVGLLVVVTIAIVGIVVSSRGETDQSGAPAASGGDASTATDAAAPADDEAGAKDGSDRPTTNNGPASGGVAEIDDDGHSLWVSPTSGEPLSLRYLPSSTQLVVALRPAEILASDEGVRLLDALGPAGQTATARLRSTLGVELADIEQLTIAFAPDESGAPQAAYMMRLAGAIPRATLLEAWGRPRAAVHNAKSFFQGAGLAYYLPADGQGRLVAIAAPRVMQDILQRDGEPLLRGGIEGLLRTSDAARHFNLLAAPSYLLTDGRGLLAGDLAKLRAPLERLFDMTIQAVLASGHLGEELFLEVRVVGSADRRPQEIADTLRAQLDVASEQLEQYTASLEPQPHGRLVIHRFPRMVQLASNFTRSAVEGRQAVLRCYLPANAAHNLLLGAGLVLFEEPGVVAPSPSSPVATAPRGAAAALDRVVSLSFPRDTLGRSLQLLAREIDARIVIRGADLQLEGITKNQSFGLDERDKTGREILVKVLALANPDGKLVYVIQGGQQEKEAIYITTRAAAAARNDPLPDGQDQKTPPKSP